jgi:hypothetical protein
MSEFKATIKGLSNPQLQGQSFSFDSRNGYSIPSVYHGPKNSILALSQQLVSRRINHQVRDLGADSELTIESSRFDLSAPDAEIPQDDWELLGSTESASIYTLPALCIAEDSTPGTIGYLQRKLSDYKQSTTGAVSISDYATNFPSSSAQTRATVAGVWDLLKIDRTSYMVQKYVLNHVRTVSSDYTKEISDVGFLHIFTITDLVSRIQDSGLLNPCPERIVSKLQYVTSALKPVDIVDKFTWGWLMSPSVERTIAGGQIQISVNYTLDYWPLVLYPLFT